MSGKRSKRKGYRLEHELEVFLKDRGIDAERVPLSGGAGGNFAGDLRIENKKAEVKGRKEGFKELYKWIEGKDMLFIRADRKEWLVVLRIEDFIKLWRGEK